MEQKTTLNNGIRILTEEIPHVHSLSIGLWVDTGSKNESEDVYGISHFIEHMLFKGTSSRNAMQIAQEIEDTGGSINAFTDKENTCFYARTLDKHLDKSIDVLSDIYLNSLFDTEEINKEKQVVIEELKMYDDSPDDLCYDTLIENVWHDHPLGHKIVGTVEAINNFSQEKIKSYMKDHYTTNQLIISVAGNIKTSEVIDKLKNKFESLPKVEAINNEPEATHKRYISSRYKDIEQLHVCLATKGPIITDENRYAYAIIDSILGGGMSSRLFQEVREKRGLAYSVGSFELMYRKAGLFGVYAGISPNNFEEMLKCTLYELDRIKSGDISENDISRAKEHLKGSLLLSMEAVKNRMMRLARNEIYYNRTISSEEIINSVDKVDYNQLVNLAKDVFSRDKMSMVAVGPIKDIPFDISQI